MYITASEITDSKRKRALLLYQAEPRVREIFKQIPETGTDADYDIAKQKLKAYFDPQPVIIVGNRIISLLFVEENKTNRSPRYPTNRSNKKHAQRNLKALDTGSNSSSDEGYLYYTMTNTKHNNKVNVK